MEQDGRDGSALVFAKAAIRGVRQAYWFVSDERFGRVSLGHQSPATDDITIINLGSQMNDAAVHYNNAFNIRLDHPALGAIFSDLKWGQIAHNVDALRGNFIRYDTPALLGFMLSASFGENDTWDVALRYQAEWQGLRFAGGIGFMDDPEDRYRDLKGSASLLHAATGLYLSGAAGVRENERSSIIDRPPAYFHYLQGGISKKWLPYGNTTIYGDLGVYRNYSVGEMLKRRSQHRSAGGVGDACTNRSRALGFRGRTVVRRGRRVALRAGSSV